MNPQNKWILLSNKSGRRLVLDNAPFGWNETKINLVRDLVYFGILKSVSVSLAFVGEGYTFLQRERLLYGNDFDVILRCYHDDDEWFFDAKVNPETYDEDRKLKHFVCDLIQSDFVQKFHNSEDVKLNVLNTLSLDRKEIAPALFQDALFRGKQIEFYTEMTTPAADTPPEIYHCTIPFRGVVNGNPGVNYVPTVYATDWDESGLSPLIIADNAIYKNTLTQNQTLEFSTTIRYSAEWQGIVLIPGDQHYLDVKLYLMNSDDTIADTLLYNRTAIKSGTIVKDLAYSGSIIVEPGQYIICVLERWVKLSIFVVDKPVAAGDFEADLRCEVTFQELSLTINQPSVIDDTTHPVILPHELFSNLVAQVNGGRFISYCFGRPDIGYDYMGELALIGITTGELLRGIDPSTVQIVCSLRDAFKSYHAIGCLGAIITEDTVRIDPLEDLIDHNISYDLGEVKELHVRPATDYMFCAIKAGYPVNEYEQENGRDEYNTTYQFTNAFRSTKQPLDIVSIFNADGYGIEFARRASVVNTGTSDSRYDALIFLIDLIENPDYGYEGQPRYMTRRMEDILDAGGIFSPETAMNLRISVGQNMLRWKKFLNIPLWRVPEHKLFFQSKDKNAGLYVTTLLGSTIDGQDIDLGLSYLAIPEERHFEVALPLEGLTAIVENPMRVVKFSYEGETFFDMILNGDAEKDSKDSVWKCLAMKPSPDVEEPQGADIDAMKWADGADDYMKWADGSDDYMLYQGDDLPEGFQYLIGRDGQPVRARDGQYILVRV